ncbi:MAG: hypothetical protein HY918_01960 [Candidatus Doudnabacteria bacterium]|nr:hypothetical protein [Candidatus Doudnabacteria bacterium]
MFITGSPAHFVLSSQRILADGQESWKTLAASAALAASTKTLLGFVAVLPAQMRDAATFLFFGGAVKPTLKQIKNNTSSLLMATSFLFQCNYIILALSVESLKKRKNLHINI